MRSRSNILFNRRKRSKRPIYSNMSKSICAISIAGLLLASSQPASASFLSAVKEWWSTQYMSDVLGVLSKQSVVSTHQITETDTRAKQTLASALSALSTNLQMKKLTADRLLSTSTPSSAKCVETTRKQVEVEQVNATQATQLNLMGMKASNLWLTSIDMQTERLNTHKDLACSYQEAALGYCRMQPTGLQFWDTDYSNIVATDALTNDQKLVANMRVVNMTMPTFDSKTTFCQDKQCSNEKISYLTKSTRSSLIANSMLSQINERSLNKEFPLGFSTN